MKINDTLSIGEDELEERFIRASGPGGQNVNKVSSAVQLRFDARRSQTLPDRVRRRLEAIAGARLTKDGVIVITAERHRTQEANRRDARDRLAALIADAARPPKFRVRTRPGKAARKRRTDDKKKRGALKRQRSSRIDD